MAANMDAFDLTLSNASAGRSPDRRIPQSLAVGSSINQTPIGCPLPACSSSFTLDELPANCFLSVTKPHLQVLAHSISGALNCSLHIHVVHLNYL